MRAFIWVRVSVFACVRVCVCMRACVRVCPSEWFRHRQSLNGKVAELFFGEVETSEILGQMSCNFDL